MKIVQLKLFLFIFFLCFCGTHSFSQNRSLDVGLRFQKAINLYYENGVTVQYSDDSLLDHRLFLGLSYVSSRLGSAMGSNALKQDNYLLSGTYFFRPLKSLQPFVRLNTGYFVSDLEYAIFDDLPNSSVLFSPEAGLSYKTKNPIKLGASFGYNIITGDGIEGPGTLFPLFVQTSLTWNIFHSTSEKHEKL